MRNRIMFAVVIFGTTLFPPLSVWAESNSQGSLAPLTLETAIQMAAEQNPELKALQENANAAQAGISKSRAWEDPMVGVRFYQVPFHGGFDQTQDIDYIVRQKFPMGGKAKAAKEMAYHEYQHRLHLLNGRGRELLRDLKEAYYKLYAVQRMIGVSRQTEATLRSIVQSAQARLAANQAMVTDATQGQTELAKVLMDREVLFQQKRELEVKLQKLIALPPNQEIPIPDKLEVPEWDTNLEPLIEFAQTKHFSIQSDKHHIEEKEWGVKVAKREYIPDINLQMEYVQKVNGTSDAFTGEMMLNVPLIVKKKQLGVKQAEAELASAQFAKAANKNEILYKVQELYSQMKSSDRILKINRGTFLPQAKQSFQASSSAYSTGKVGFFDLLNASRMLFDAQMDYWKAFQSQAYSVYALEEAVGMTREEYAAMKNENTNLAPESAPSDL